MTPTSEADELRRALFKLAEAGRRMRRTQNEYFAAKKKQPKETHEGKLSSARTAERLFDSALKEAERYEQQTIPGMEAEGGAKKLPD